MQDIILKSQLDNNGREIKVYAFNKDRNIYPLPPEIYNMTLDIYSSQLEDSDGIIGLDVFDYVLNRREYEEIFTITSDILGQGEALPIKDGIYKLELFIEGDTTSNIYTDKFVCLYNIRQKLKDVVEQNDYEIEEITEEFVEMQSDSSLGKTEQIRLAVNIYNEIEVAAKKDDEEKVNNKLYQLNRILKIIKE